jgi:hypothetical protein
MIEKETLLERKKEYQDYLDNMQSKLDIINKQLRNIEIKEQISGVHERMKIGWNACLSVQIDSEVNEYLSTINSYDDLVVDKIKFPADSFVTKIVFRKTNKNGEINL